MVRKTDEQGLSGYRERTGENIAQIKRSLRANLSRIERE